MTKISCEMLRKRPRVGGGVGTGEIVAGGRTNPDNDDCSGRDDSWVCVVYFSESILLIYYGCECLIARSMPSFVFGASRKST